VNHTVTEQGVVTAITSASYGAFCASANSFPPIACFDRRSAKWRRLGWRANWEILAFFAANPLVTARVTMLEAAEGLADRVGMCTVPSTILGASSPMRIRLTKLERLALNTFRLARAAS
jgi:hypothetical protein